MVLEAAFNAGSLCGILCGIQAPGGHLRTAGTVCRTGADAPAGVVVY